MPRIYDSTSDPLDFCIVHFPSHQTAFERYGSRGDGPDGRGNCFGYDAEHPNYDGEDYTCEVCNKPLTGKDN
jgi:hypothetical protein